MKPTLPKLIEEAVKDFDNEFYMQRDVMVSRAGLSYGSVKPQAMPGEVKRFLREKLEHIAKEALAATELPKAKMYLERGDEGWNAAIRAQEEAKNQFLQP